MRHIPPNQMQMQPYFVVDPNQPVSMTVEGRSAEFDPADFIRAERRARQAMALVVVGLLAICGAMASAAHAPSLVAFTKHVIRTG